MNNQSFNVIIWSFGTSDLYVNWKTINTREKNFLEETKQISENFENYRIDFPVFRQFVEQIINWNYENVVVKWIFTDQDFHTDTIYLKDIFEKWLKKKYWWKIKFARNHIILDEANKVDNLADKMRKQFEEQFSRLGYDNILVNLTWWTKWMFWALILSTISYFPLNKLHFFYWERLGETDETLFSKQDVNEKIISNQVKQISTTYNYEAIKLFLEENSYEALYKKLWNIVNYGLSRLLCDWDMARKYYSTAKLPSKFLISNNEKKINKLEESINWIVYTWRHNYLAEFMGRVYNFVDKTFINEGLKDIFWKVDITYDDIVSILDKYEDLEDFLNKCKVENLPDWWMVYIWVLDRWQNLRWNSQNLTYLQWDDKFISTLVWLALLDYFSDKWLVSRQIFDYWNKLQYLNQYRNQTIIWHWIKPINKKIIEEKLQTNDVEWFFKSILKEISWKDTLWIDELNKQILSAL